MPTSWIPSSPDTVAEGLDAWITRLRVRLARGELGDLGPLMLSDGKKLPAALAADVCRQAGSLDDVKCRGRWGPRIRCAQEAEHGAAARPGRREHALLLSSSPSRARSAPCRRVPEA